MTKHDEYLYATSGLLIFLISLLIYLRLVFKLPSETSPSSNRPPPGGHRPQVWIVPRSSTAASVDIIHPLPTAPQIQHETERRDLEARRFRILTSVLHKKAVPRKGGDYNKIILPHEEELSYRSIRNGYDEEAPPEQEEGGKNQTTSNFIIPGSPHQENESDNRHKTDIIISAPKKLSSWRSKSMKGMHMFGKSDRDISIGSLLLYSPKACPICLESYRAGDEICWSKNENCPHAFHLECMTEWLMENDDCPMCRENCLEGSNDKLCAHPTP